MSILDILSRRDMSAQVTRPEELASHLSKPRTVYLGIDPTAPSLHVGHLVPIMALHHWYQAGHKVVLLVGGGTTMVGDPSGKTDMRQMLTLDDIERNTAAIKDQLGRLFDFSDKDRVQVVNNYDWLSKLNYLEMLREVGVHFSVNRMLTAECFKQRLEKGLSFLEFNYMILQSYDFYHLNKTMDVTVQIGGDDQWSNILGGMELVRRISGGEAYGLTVPLLLNSEGKKMGKTESGAVWIDPDRTPPFDYFQYFRNVDDDMVIRCMRLLTTMTPEAIDAFSHLKGRELNDAKSELAYQATLVIHGEAHAKAARDQAKRLFSSDRGPDLSGAPSVDLQKGWYQPGMPLVDLLVAAGIFPSKSEARRLINQGGLSINEQKVVDLDRQVNEDDFNENGQLLVRKGKKHYFSLKK